MIGFIADWIKGLLATAGAFFSGFFVGKLREEKQQAEKERDDAKDDAQGWADRPRDYDEFSERMRARAKRKKNRT